MWENIKVQAQAHNSLMQQVTFEKTAETVNKVAKPAQVSLYLFVTSIRFSWEKKLKSLKRTL